MMYFVLALCLLGVGVPLGLLFWKAGLLSSPHDAQGWKDEACYHMQHDPADVEEVVVVGRKAWTCGHCGKSDTDPSFHRF